MKQNDGSAPNDVEKTRRAEVSSKGKAREKAKEIKENRDAFAKQARIAIERRDVRGFTELLKLAEISDGTLEWERAWRAFYQKT